ncbi:glutamate-5-semialdehyde dehydrogenase [Aliarcobacter cryaerophilus]|jgi:glutamate-5-semialdehyde dehydrogenase|uniref:Gamma-glutamyl phosphate reductase n=2 Tax=unclassified Arcobacter TaxID=2593671 RepID=A0AA96CPK7_9BACT|nr:glutamate-5-semialdehyde dehydrogenase [Aliarcobacter cryaerophilus]OQA75707.1 MAG: Gamma-glutamyl phosphate reductase [Candidatus Dependentiae bacterium ADurb.Bin246]WNL13326.1 glutamate-5-semialdehyde dehydrogenase [Arcobacter sp. AZ-2023]WPD09811.1 glutamate-5-semialdehyde dehydrogenase [Arcobacter sp. DSM 115954]MCT7495083.1 glutamate-5-semialdehyde dehydrogenase [Aliarcobacter cryaerophilus]MCT7500052.1 glutamate-5-semialdehyde dehydrogenase [Aliarcobacter cryaerophilus]
MKEFLQKAKESSRVVATLSTAIKNKTLLEFADALEENSCFIIEENIKDMKLARELDLSSAMQDRLYLNDSRIQDMANAIRQIASQTEPVGRVLDGWLTKDNLNIQKVSIPIGVIAIIYESRPNVTSDTAALCFKSGNVCVLKGGKEAENSNRAIAKIIQDVLEKNNLPKEIVSLLPDSSREGVAKLIVEDKYVDLIVPRGGEALIKFITQNSSIPVIKHDKGVCHTFIDKDANATKSINIVVNAKCQRPSACNSLETLLVHEEIASYILPGLQEELSAHGTILKGCPKTLGYIKIAPAKEEDFDIEYLENILNIKVVENLNEAIDHISKHGSGHSEAILSENYTAINKFLNEVDAACVYANASTRFTDGGEFGLGAEVGISTNKLHSRGPMGINDLTTFKYKIYGQGQVRTK